MEKYSLKTSKKKNKPGQWDSILCEIHNSKGERLGEYIRHYPSFVESTFFPFQMNGKDYALYSADYNTVSVMSLPDCKPIELKPECVEQLNNFCPVEIYIPRFSDRGDSRLQLQKGDHEYETGYTGFSSLAFVSGCVWGDDYSWKLNLLDLSNIEKGELWYVDNSLNKNWLYEDLGASLSQLNCYFEKESTFPSAYNQIVEIHQDFQHNILKELEINEFDIVLSTTQIDKVPRETKGTVAHVYADRKTFEVEFFEGEKPLGVFTVKKHQLKKLNKSLKS